MKTFLWVAAAMIPSGCVAVYLLTLPFQPINRDEKDLLIVAYAVAVLIWPGVLVLAIRCPAKKP
jgi:hypothetical protein